MTTGFSLTFPMTATHSAKPADGNLDLADSHPRVSVMAFARRCLDRLLAVQSDDPFELSTGAIQASVTLLLVLASALAFIVFMSIHGSFSRCATNLVSVAFFTAIYFDNRRGHVQRSKAVLIASLIILPNALFWFTTTDVESRLVALMSWAVPIVVSASILRSRHVLVFGVACGLNVALLLTKTLPPPWIQPSSQLYRHLASTEFVLATVTILMALVRRQSDKYQSALLQRNSELADANQQSDWQLKLLKNEVEEREHDLTAARDAALDANQAQRQFVTNMSHELRTPMNAVVGMTELLLETSLDHRQREFVETLRTSANHLLSLLNDVLLYSKLDAKAVQLEQVLFDPRACVHEAVSLVAHAATQKGLRVRIDIDEGVPDRVVGDSLRLRQVLSNLLSNAVKFTAQGEVTIQLRAQTLPTGRIELSGFVRDTGIGIAAEDLSRLFRPFSQADASTTRAFGGTGLGLVISRQLTEQMEGSVRVESKKGEGSTFFFSLRVGSAASATGDALGTSKRAPSQLSMSTPKPPSSTLLGQKHPLRILLAEDNAINQRVALLYLEKLGYRADVVADGQAAVDAVAANIYDVVLMDAQMPVMDGLEATRTILRTPDGIAGRRPRIIAITAHALPGDRQQCLEAGMDGYLEKPLSLQSLETTLRQVQRRNVL